MLDVSPKGTVPVLVLPDGSVLEESLDIMRWALGHEDPDHWLEPAEANDDEALQLICRNDGEFKFHLDRYKYEGRHEAQEPRVDHREAAGIFLLQLEARLRQGPWLLGPSLSLADAAIAPFVRQFANTDRSWFDSQPWPKLVSWLNDFLDSALFAGVMDKHRAWVVGDPATIFPNTRAASWTRSI
jgi:glutathione S-transferase